LERLGRGDINILEPACGLAQFLLGIKRMHPYIFSKANLYGMEINTEIIQFLSQLEISREIHIIQGDYLLWDTDLRFDLIIGNPPYGIPTQSDHYPIKIDAETKQKYRSLYDTWYGKYNVYGAFIEKSVKLLKEKGQLIFIVPATFLILDEFKKLRRFLSCSGGTAIIYLGPDVFKPEADVACVILNFLKSNKLARRLELYDYQQGRLELVKTFYPWEGEVVTFQTAFTENLGRICSYKVKDIYEVRISPRTPEIKNNPLIIKSQFIPSEDFLPILNGRNLKRYEVVYQNYTGYWIRKQDIKKLRSFFGSPHIVVGLGFREGGKVAAAYDYKGYPWMGDVYHLLRKQNLFGFDLQDVEVVEYLNSEEVSRFVRETYKEITYHLSISQIENLPLPTKVELQKIRESLR
ncbi:Eco57I restriction-modification methylase domain-containing protein, partial [bacterium]|nr:Eco57I restriction-modification methylase domain-containing protein [bacterium]